jgi:hypothetical protein
MLSADLVIIAGMLALYAVGAACLAQLYRRSSRPILTNHRVVLKRSILRQRSSEFLLPTIESVLVEFPVCRSPLQLWHSDSSRLGWELRIYQAHFTSRARARTHPGTALACSRCRSCLEKGRRLLIVPLTLPVGLEAFVLIPSVFRPLSWSRRYSGALSWREGRKSQTRSRPRMRPLPLPAGSTIAYPVAAIRVFPRLAVKPPRRRSQPHLSRFADCHAEAVLILLFPPPFLAGTAGCRYLLRPGGAALLCFPATRDPPGFRSLPRKVWPPSATAAERTFFRFPRKIEAWPAEQAPLL